MQVNAKIYDGAGDPVDHVVSETIKIFLDNIPKTVDEMLRRVDDYLRSKEAFRNTELPKGELQQKEVSDARAPRTVHATVTSRSGVSSAERKQSGLNPGFVGKYLPRNLSLGTPAALTITRTAGRAINSFGIWQVEPFGERCKAMGKNRAAEQWFAERQEWMNVPITFPPVLARDLSEEALVVEAEVEGYLHLRAIPSTIHGMMKFPTPWGIATLVSQKPIISECRMEGKKQAVGPPEEIKPQEEVGLTEQDMTRVPKRIIKHSLNANPSVTPVSPKRRVFYFEKSQVITKEAVEWLKAGIVRPVKYPTWISNPVLVKKVDGRWQMCIDFKNINVACLKDYYPLPEIDSKIESVMGFPFKCFLFAYKGYHQVQMAEEDEEKTAFYTDQDDMVVKSKFEREMLADIAETFNNIRRINMKLNPKKCLFGVEEGKFLGYMVTSEGIRANPAKTKDIAEIGIGGSSQGSAAGNKKRKAISGALRPLLKASGKVRIVIMAVDYFTKWIEAKPLSKTTGKEVKKFVWDNIVCMYGLPKIIVSDNGTNFIHDPFKSCLTFESEAVIPTEFGMPTHQTMMIKEGKGNEEEIRLNFDLLQERREAAAIREARYKMKIEHYYNKRVRPMSFKVGEYVYRKNKANRVENLGKLGPKWEGPYLVVEAYQNGLYKLRTMDDKEVPRVWQAINLRRCYL
nr:hypothetical protein [Tanacetum cinerariifolium]